MSIKNVLISLAAGAATGAALGILFAPAKGAVTRRTIYRKGERGMEDLKDKFNEIIDEITDKFETVKEDVNHLANKANATMDKGEKEVKQAKV